MAGIYEAMDIARKALFANQIGIQVVSHNVANVNTPGYSRQVVELSESTPQNFLPGQIGTGVDVTAIVRKVDQFLEGQLVTEGSSYGELKYSASALGQVEGMLDDTTGENLGKAITEFFNAWDDLANNPSGQAERQTVVSTAQALSSMFQRLDARLRTLQDSADSDVVSSTDEVNQIANQIAALNGRIKDAVGSRENPNDLMDQRSVLIQSLSEKINVTSVTDATGEVTIFVANGRPLVSGETAGELSAVPDSSNDARNAVYLRMPGQSAATEFDITAEIRSGELRAAVDFRDEYAAEMQSRLDSLAYAVATDVNAVHTAGYGLDGTTGVNFFVPVAPSGAAGTIAVNDAVSADVGLVAAATEDPTAGGGVGDNRNALLLAGLQDGKVASLGDGTYNDFLAGLLGKIGADVKGVNQDLSYQQNIMDYLNGRRDEVSGVSLDEEMTNLMKFQRAYQAATKLITVTDDLLKQVIDLR